MNPKKLYILPIASIIAFVVFLSLVYLSYNILGDLENLSKIDFGKQKFTIYYSIIENDTKIRYLGELNLTYVNSSCHKISIDLVNYYKFKEFCCLNNCTNLLYYDPYLLAKALAIKKIKGVKTWFLKIKIDNTTLNCKKVISIRLDENTGILYCINKKVMYYKVFNYTKGRELELVGAVG